MKRLLTICAVVTTMLAVSGSVNATTPFSGQSTENPPFTGSISFDTSNMYVQATVEDAAIGFDEDYFAIGLDTDNDGLWDASTDAIFVYDYFNNDGASWRIKEALEYSGGVWDCPWSAKKVKPGDPGWTAGLAFSTSTSGNDLIYSATIPFAAMGIAAGDTIGLLVQIRDKNSTSYGGNGRAINYWPDSTCFNKLYDPAQYQDITIPGPVTEVWVDDGWTGQADVNLVDPSLTWQYDAFSSLQDGVDAVAVGGTVNVRDGVYGVAGQTNQYGYATAILIKEKNDLTIQAAPGHEPVVQAVPVMPEEPETVSISIEDCDGLTIDNIDSDQTIAQFDNWHVFDSDDLTVRNSRFEGGEDGIDFNTDLTTALIENNEFVDINTGSGDEVLDFTDGSYSDVVIQDNVFENNYRHITINPPSGDAASDFIIRRNFMDGTTSQEGVRFNDGGGPVSDVILENNVIMNSRQQGLYVKPPVSDITVRHNTFFNNSEEELRLREAAGDVVLKNNIIYANGTHAAISARAPYPPGPLAGEDYNLIFNDGPSTESGSASPITVFGANTITGLDPLFVSTIPGSEDLHLQAGSPAIEAGTGLGVSDDVEKSSRPNPVGTDPDIGAYEVGRPAPRAAKLIVVDNLQRLLPAGEKKTDHRIEKAIDHIEKSLDEKLWEDESHLTKKGKKVFDEEKKAVHELMKIVKAEGPCATEAKAAIDTLVGVDALLAQGAIDQAKDAGGDPKEIAKAEEEMTKALEELDHTKKDGTPDPRYDKAIDHYKKAWEHACKAKETKKTKTAAIEPLAIADELKVVAYPNPIRDVNTATFQVMGMLAAEVEELRVQIYDLSGHLVWEDAAFGGELDWHTDSLSGDYLANGMYLYRVQVRIDGNWINQDIGRIAVLR